MQPEPVEEQPQPDVDATDVAAVTEAPDAKATRRTQIMTKRPDPAVLKKLRIWSKHSRPLMPVTVSDQPKKRARIPETHAEVNLEAFAMMLESDRNLRARPREDVVK